MHRLGTPRPHEAIEPQDFSAPQREGNIGKFGGVGKSVHLQHGFANGDIALGENLIDRPAHHQADELGLGDGGKLAFAHLLAIAQANESVGDAKNLVELVRDENDGAALGF